jgi:poly[(R)-3-hydroxyalkanoate] polymerase subunit PhaC
MIAVPTRESHIDASETEPVHSQTGSSVTPMTQDITKAVQVHKEDPWITLIERLWEAIPYSDWVPVDVGEILNDSRLIWLDTFRHPFRLWKLSNDLVQQSTQVMANSALALWGLRDERKPVIEPEAGDRRFSAPDWQQNPAFDALKQTYLLLTATCLQAVSGIEGLNGKELHRLTFLLRLWLDAISPTNFAFTNPQVIHETIATGGQNFLRGMQHLLRDLEEGQIKITDTSAFAVGKNLALTPGQVVYRNQLIELIQYAPTTGQVYQNPILLIPPWINKYYVLDLQPQDSFVKFLVDRGFTVFVISWKNPDASMAEVGFDDYVTLGPLTALEVIKQITGSPKINTAGFCIAGELLATVPPYLAAQGDDTINAVTFVVTAADLQAQINDMIALFDEPTLRFAEHYLEVAGTLDSRQMALMFNLLRANELVWSNAINNYLLGKEPAAFDQLYWNNDGTRVTRKSHTFYLRHICMENGLAKHGELIIKDVPIDLRNLRQDVYTLAMARDHIVPWKAGWRMTQLAGGSTRFVLGSGGHVAGVVAPPDKAHGYWTNEKLAAHADEWREGATFHEGSWWLDWIEWLQARSGELVAPPSMGSQAYPPLVPAPGTYVLEK